MKTLRFLPRFACLAFPLLSALAQASESGPTIPLPDEDRMAIETYLGKGVVGQAIPAPEIADTHRYLATNPSAREFRLVSGPDAGQTERHQPTLLKRDAGGTTWRYDEGGKFVYFLIGKANGDYVNTGVQDTKGGTITKYSPSEPFMLQGLTPGQERNVKLGVMVFDLSNPDEQTHEGTLDVNYRYVGAYQGQGAGGQLRCGSHEVDLQGESRPRLRGRHPVSLFRSGCGHRGGDRGTGCLDASHLQPPR